MYSQIFPETADIEKIAWLFNAEYKSASKEDKELNGKIKAVVLKWMDKWKGGKENIPSLKVTKSDDKFFIEDSRFGYLMREEITRKQAQVSLFGVTESTMDILTWGKEKKVIYYYEGNYIPLATAHPTIFKELENEC